MLEFRTYVPGDIGRMMGDGTDAQPEAYVGEAWTMVRDFHPILCAGLTHIWEGRALAWSMSAGAGPREWLRAMAFMSGVMDERTGLYPRIEAHALPGQSQILRRLGFAYEGLMRRALPGGVGDYELWARVS